MTFKEKLQAIRNQMRTDGVDAYVIPSADPHISEYLPDHYKCISFATGFKGSVSTVVITQEFAGLWADSRYFEQAEEQLAGSGYQLVKLKAQHTPEYISWLDEVLEESEVVAFDEKMVSVALAQHFNQILAYKKIQFKHKDYLQPIWQDRPALPSEPAFLVADEFTGQSTKDKLTAIRKVMKQHRADYHLISSLDDMAWVFNLRGRDVKYNPVVLSFAILTENEATLYIQNDKLSDHEKASLTKSGVEILSYDTVAKDLPFLKAESSILIDPRRNCLALFKLIPSSVKIIKETNPSTFLKSRKNTIEIENTRIAMQKDGVAITRFLKWVKENVGNIKMTELSAAAQLRDFRAEQEGFFGESFNTIAAYKAHGALPHYASTPESDTEIQADGLFLVDSGGQYFYGTTDITRVIPLGNITEEERTDYTLVLKGMIEGCKTRFPKGTCGYAIDAITRRPLWDYAINFGHGTGHGVGYFLNVHEGPQVFNGGATPIPIELGMITSIEPGIYRPGKHGIRIENLVLTIQDETNAFNEFYAFESLTLAPIDTSIVNKELLEQSQIDWLNNYHQLVFEKLSPSLNEEERLFLQEMTRAI
ncbi:aminopeptidase P family protein [Pedobacter sp. Du54]|uniref:aminopeptidase P family protein n=1 Tax=Pedobacter anseongensis TaxID=3133439 RepID=UPI0030A53B74